MNKRKFISMLAALAALPGTLTALFRLAKPPVVLRNSHGGCPLGPAKPGEKCFSYSGTDVPECHLFQPRITPNPEEWCANNMVGLEYTGFDGSHGQIQMRVTACCFRHARVHIHAVPV